MLQSKDRVAEWIQKQNPYVCCLQETHFRPKDTDRLKVRRLWKILNSNGNESKSVVAILISDNIDFKNKGCHKRQRRTLHNYQEYTKIENIYTPSIGVPNYKKHVLTDTRGKIHSNTIISRHFNTNKHKVGSREEIIKIWTEIFKK